MKPFRLSRRTVLRGVGLAPISIALPVLDAMLDGRGELYSSARGQTGAKPNFLLVFMPNGVYPEAFWPTGSGTNYTLSRCLMPLAPYKADFNVYQNLRKDEAFRGQDINTDAHARGHASFSTGGSITATGVEFASADQIAAAQLGGDTKFRSLVVALGGARPPLTNNQNFISWTGPDAPVPAERNPVSLFNKLFGGGAPTPAPMQPSNTPAPKLVDYRKSILDCAKEEMTALQPKLGARDKATLDRHFTAIRDLEKQILPGAGGMEPAGGGGGAVSPPSASCTTPTAPPASMNNEPPGIDNQNGTYTNERMQALISLQVMAFSCGLTRFGTFQMANRSNKRQFPWLNATDGADGHHGISHDSTAEGYEKQAKIVTDEVEQFAFMLKLMKEAKQGDKDLLYNSIVFFASEHGHGEGHDFTNVPVIIAGQGGGQIRTGRFVIYKTGTKYSNMFVALLNMVGMNVTKFGALGDAPLPDVG